MTPQVRPAALTVENGQTTSTNTEVSWSTVQTTPTRTRNRIERIAAFDVDGTLIDETDTPRHNVIDLLRSLYALGYRIVVWSGGGIDYAQHWVDRLGIGRYVFEVRVKDRDFRPDVAVDDKPDADLGIVALVV